jgi:hypothetical protein
MTEMIVFEFAHVLTLHLPQGDESRTQNRSIQRD